MLLFVVVCKLFCRCSSSPQRSLCENICWSCQCRMSLVSFMFHSNSLVIRVFCFSVFNFSFRNSSWIGISEKYTHKTSWRFITSRCKDAGIHIRLCARHWDGFVWIDPCLLAGSSILGGSVMLYLSSAALFSMADHWAQSHNGYIWKQK